MHLKFARVLVCAWTGKSPFSVTGSGALFIRFFLLMQPVFPAVGVRGEEKMPAIRQEGEDWTNAPRSPKITRKHSRTSRRGEPIDERSRSGPSTPSPRIASQLSEEAQDALARSIVEKLSLFQARLESQMTAVALETRRSQIEEHDLIMIQLSDFHRDSLQFANDNRVWREDIQRSIMVVQNEQMRLDAASRVLQQQVQDQSAMLDVKMESNRRRDVPLSRENDYQFTAGNQVPLNRNAGVVPPPVCPESRPRPPPIPSESPPMRWESDERVPEMGRTAQWQLHRISLPPKFEAKNLEGWFREVRFWRSLHRHIDDHQLLACLGLHSVEEIKELLMDFFECATPGLTTQSLEDFLEKVKSEYGAVSDVIKAEKLSQLMAFKKKAEWDIRKFWRRFHQLQMRSRQAGVELDENIQFTQLFQALSLSNTQRQMVLAFFETSNSTKSIINLKAITIRLFGTYCSDPLGTFVNKGGESATDEDSEEDDLVLAAGGAPKKKTRPGMEKTSLRRTTQSMGIQNGRGGEEEVDSRFEGQRRFSTGSAPSMDMHFEMNRNPGNANAMKSARCLRCGSMEHFWRQCPHPFRKNLTFGGTDQKTKGSGSLSTKEQLKKTLLAATEELLNFDSEEIKINGPDNDDIPDSINVTSTLVPPALDDTLVWVCSVFRAEEESCQMNGTTSIIIDSGASGSVCSRKFAVDFGNGLWESRRPSTRRFKFGDSRTFPSEGSIIILCTISVIRENLAVQQKNWSHVRHY